MTTVAAQWHTPNPPAPVVSAPPQQQPNISVGLLERLLHRYGNPRSTELGRADDLTLYQTYSAVFGAPQGPQNSYKMMAALATPNDIKAWLEEWKYAPLGRAAPSHATYGEVAVHTALDERLPNGIIRHRHHTAVGANRGPPRRNPISGLIDPYLGTGLDPSHLSGVVTAPEGAPYMACCGQELGPDGEIPPGCWIGQRNPQGSAVPYQVWFQRMDGDAIWQAIAAGNATAVFTAATQVGTAFLDRAYYADLDRQIRELLTLVIPDVVQAQFAILQAQFPAGVTIANALDQETSEHLERLIGLVETYNAPQRGAEKLGILVNNDFLDSQVFRLQEGRNAFISGRLALNVQRNGISIPSVLGSLAQIPAVVATLRPHAPFADMVALLDRIQQLQTRLERQQRKLVQRKPFIDDIESEFVKLQVTIPGILSPLQFTRLDGMQNQFAMALRNVLRIYSQWARGGNIDTAYLPQVEASWTNLRGEFKRLPRRVVIGNFRNALRRPVSQVELDAVLQLPTYAGYGNLLPVQTYARFHALIPGMTQILPSTGAELAVVDGVLEGRALTAVANAKADAAAASAAAQAQRDAAAAAQAQRDAAEAARRAATNAGNAAAIAGQLKAVIDEFIANDRMTPDYAQGQIANFTQGDARWDKVVVSFIDLSNPTFRPLWKQTDEPKKFFYWLIDRCKQSSAIQQRPWENEYDQRLEQTRQVLQAIFDRGQWVTYTPVTVPDAIQADMVTRISKSSDVRSVKWYGFVFDQASCAYDSLFPALFIIQGQWLQEAIRRAKQLTPLISTCQTQGALAFHKTMEEEITYIEGKQQGPPRCVLINAAWNGCIPSKDPNIVMEDDPRIMLQGLIEFYNLRNKVVTLWYGDALPVIGPAVEMIVIETAEAGPFNVSFTLDQDQFTLVSCVAHTTNPAGHWRSFVHDPQTSQWFRFDPKNERQADAAFVSRDKIPAAVMRSTDGFVPKAWFYFRTNRLPKPAVVGGGGSVGAGSASGGGGSSVPNYGGQILKELEDNRYAWFGAKLPSSSTKTVLDWLGLAVKQAFELDILAIRQAGGRGDENLIVAPAGNPIRYYNLLDQFNQPADEYGFLAFLQDFFLGTVAVTSTPKDPAAGNIPIDDYEYPLSVYRVAFQPILQRTGLMIGNDWTRASFPAIPVSTLIQKWNLGRDGAFDLILQLSQMFLVLLHPIVDRSDNFVPIEGPAGMNFIALYNDVLRKLKNVTY